MSAVVEDGGRKRQADAIILPFDRNCRSSAAGARLDDGHRDLAARQKLCGLAGQRDEIGLCEAFHQPFLLEGRNQRIDLETMSIDDLRQQRPERGGRRCRAGKTPFKMLLEMPPIRLPPIPLLAVESERRTVWLRPRRGGNGSVSPIGDTTSDRSGRQPHYCLIQKIRSHFCFRRTISHQDRGRRCGRLQEYGPSASPAATGRFSSR